ncbi:MAG TPA: hypothetical protein VFZ33_18350 [Chitinophagaceae bacterium]
MKLRTVDIVILLLLGLACIARGTWGLFKDIYVDLSEAKTVTGVVTYADITQIQKFTFRSKKYSTVFGLKLNNSDQNFVIDRGADFCKHLKDNIRIGDTIKLLYRLSTSDQNSFVFQVEKDEHTLANYSEYRKKEIKMIVLAYAFGLIIIGGLIFWYVNKKKQARETQT